MNIPTDTNLLIPMILLILNEGLKKYFAMSSKFAILINWGGGIGLNIAFLYPFSTGQELLMAIIVGFLLGSSAGGLYDGAKPAVQIIKTAVERKP